MKLVLDVTEAEEALLAWGKQFFQQQDFNRVEFDIGYGIIRSITLTHKEPEVKEGE